MSFNTNWDIEKYKNNFENDEHWELRKIFMVTHKHKFPEDRLVCLAQTFVNIEVLGCTYPKRTMDQIEELAQDIAAEYRKRKKAKLQRTFIKASDAAEAKIKGSHRRPDTQSGTSSSRCSPFYKSHEYQTMRPKSTLALPAEAAEGSHRRPDTQICSPICSPFFKSLEYQTMRPKHPFALPAEAAEGSHRRPDTQRYSPRCSPFFKSLEYQTMRPNNPFALPAEAAEGSHRRPDTESGTSSSGCSSFYKSQEYQTVRPKNPFAAFGFKNENVKLLGRLQFGMSDLGLPLRFIIMIDSKDFIPMNVLEQSVRLANIKLDYKFNNEDDKIECKVYLNELLMGQAIEFTKKTSRNNAIIKAIDLLRKSHFVLEKKCNFVPGTLLNTKSCDKAEDIPLPENNVGLKMMVKMGWTGSGLGQRKQGIVAPVKATSQNENRAGLGIDVGVTNINSMRNRFQNIFREFSANDTKLDLVFSSELSSLERKLLHQLAHKFQLKSQSFGKGEERQLVISKPLFPKTIVYDLLVSGQMENEKYRLIKPENL